MWHLDGVEIAGSESLTLTLSLGDGDASSPFWPEPFRAIYTVTFARTLSLRLAVQNRAMHPILFEEALHTYFAVSDITAIAISGLAGTTYIDKTEAGRRKPQTAALVTLTAETDRVYLDTPARCVLEDRGWRRRIASGRAWCGTLGPKRRPPWPISAILPGAAWFASRQEISPTTSCGSPLTANTRCQWQFR